MRIIQQSTGLSDGSVSRIKLTADARANNIFDPSASFMRDRGDGIMVSVYDTFIKHIYDIRLYNVGKSDRIFLWRIWKNGEYFQVDFKDSNDNIVAQAKELISSLDFVSDKPSILEIKPYNIYKVSGFITLNLYYITSTINITNLTASSTLLSQTVYEHIDNNYSLYPFKDYPNNNDVKNAVIDVKVFGDKTHEYALDALRVNFGATFSYIIEIKDVTANKIVSRIQDVNQFNPGIYTISIPEYQSSGITATITLNIGSTGFTYSGLNLKLQGSCIYDRGYDILLPAYIPVVVNRELNIYSENIISNAYASQVTVIMEASGGIHGKDKFVFKPTAAGTTVLKATAKEKGIDTLIKRINLIAVDENAGSGLTKKVLVIGDSKTDNPTKLAELLNLFSNDGMQIELIGTIVETGTDSIGNTRTVKGEGRSGWGIDDYYNKASYNGFTNPFFNSSTSLFDFSYYMTSNGFTGVDYVIIDLGANDTGLIAKNIKTYYDHIINSIRAYNSNIKIILSLQEGHSLLEPTTAPIQQQKIVLNKIVKGLLEWYSGKESENIYLLPQYVNLDLYNDFPTTQVASSSRNPTLVTKCTDYTHPSAYGYYKIADMYYYMLKYLASIGA